MRDAFIGALEARFAEDDRLVLLTGDLGFGVLTRLAEAYPDRFFNAGVAEQNMTAMAAGLAMEGHVVFTYSIGNFSTLRCLEQLRNDVCYHEANVKTILVGGGFSYGQLGMSHHATEDLAALRALPEMAVVAPCDRWEASQAVAAVIDRPGPVYVRLDKTLASPDRLGDDPFVIGRARTLRDGDALTIIGIGGILAEALAAADVLERDHGIACRVVSMHTLKPLDREAIRRAAAETGGILTIEEHTVVGGLGGAVAEACMDHGWRPRAFRRIGLNDTYSSVVGDPGYLRAHYGMAAGDVVEAVRAMVAPGPERAVPAVDRAS